MFLYLSSTESRYKTQLGYGGIVFALDVLDTANMSGMSFNYSINDEIINYDNTHLHFICLCTLPLEILKQEYDVGVSNRKGGDNGRGVVALVYSVSDRSSFDVLPDLLTTIQIHQPNKQTRTPSMTNGTLL